MNYINDLISRYPTLSVCEDSIRQVVQAMTDSFAGGGRLYVCGNGGSAADALHIVGELCKSFVLPRYLDQRFLQRADPTLTAHLQGAFPALALVENAALSTAYINDMDAVYAFAQQIYAYAREGDCVLGISTSGNAENVKNALLAARGRGAVTLGLTGRDGGKMKTLCDTCIIVPEKETYKIQELHLPVYHAICLALEEQFWGTK